MDDLCAHFGERFCYWRLWCCLIDYQEMQRTEVSAAIWMFSMCLVAHACVAQGHICDMGGRVGVSPSLGSLAKPPEWCGGA